MSRAFRPSRATALDKGASLLSVEVRSELVLPDDSVDGEWFLELMSRSSRFVRNSTAGATTEE